MSNTVRCREAHGGKFTRPKKLWKGRKRGARRTALAADMSAMVSRMTNNSQAVKDTSQAGKKFGVLNFRRKAG